MTNETKKITITILGQKYTIVSDEAEERILQAATLVSTEMQEILQKSSSLETQKVAILVALKYVSKFLEQKTTMQHFANRENELIAIINREM